MALGTFFWTISSNGIRLIQSTVQKPFIYVQHKEPRRPAQCRFQTPLAAGIGTLHAGQMTPLSQPHFGDISTCRNRFRSGNFRATGSCPGHGK